MPTRGADWPMQYETVRSWLHRMNKPCPARFHGWNYRATFKIYFDIMEYLHHLHHTHIHNSIISIHAYMSSNEMMDTWWHVVSACSLENCQVAHGLIAQIEKEETHASGKIEKKQPISLDSCHQMSRVCPVGMASRWYSDLFAFVCTKNHCNTGGVIFFGKHMLKKKAMKSESTWK